jgi:hypothetical protein
MNGLQVGSRKLSGDTEGELMLSSENLKFAPWFMPNVSVDSNCSRCLVTFASAANEIHLLLKEELHVCDPFLIAHYEFFGKMPVSSGDSSSSA